MDNALKYKLQICNSMAEFFIFTQRTVEDGSEVPVENETVWLTQKLINVLFERGGEQDRRTSEKHFRYWGTG